MDEKLRQRMFKYLIDGQGLERDLASEIADNLTDVVEEWLRFMRDFFDDTTATEMYFSELLSETRERYERKKARG